MFRVSEPYRDRETDWLGVREENGWRLKCYAIRYGNRELERETYELGLRLALNELPDEAVARDRPGVGFVIFHQGRGDHYLVLNWWGLENELFNRVYVREFGRDSNWRRAVDRGIACVWDLKVLWHERQAYVRHALCRAGNPDLNGYIDDTFDSVDDPAPASGAHDC